MPCRPFGNVPIWPGLRDSPPLSMHLTTRFVYLILSLDNIHVWARRFESQGQSEQLFLATCVRTTVPVSDVAVGLTASVRLLCLKNHSQQQQTGAQNHCPAAASYARQFHRAFGLVLLPRQWLGLFYNEPSQLSPTGLRLEAPVLLACLDAKIRHLPFQEKEW